jgi:hypothetical protein
MMNYKMTDCFNRLGRRIGIIFGFTISVGWQQHVYAEGSNTIRTLILNNDRCIAPEIPNLKISERKLSEYHYQLYEIEKKGVLSYYSQFVTLKLEASDGEDVLKADSDGILRFDDNDQESASVVFEVNFDKLFGFKADKKAELQKHLDYVTTKKTQYKSTVIDAFLAFKNEQEKTIVAEATKNSLTLNSEFETLVKTRTNAVAYFLITDPTGPCLVSWLSSDIE